MSSLAYAQVCNPTSPQLDPGTGFAPFGANEQLLVRKKGAGKKGAVFELISGR